jgi:hypothetical protein
LPRLLLLIWNMTIPKGGKMQKPKVLICLILLGIAASAAAFTPFDGVQDQAVSIAYYDQDPVFLSNLIPLTTNYPSWNAFLKQHGRWAGQANGLTGLIHRAWGDPIYVGIPANEDAASSLAKSFLLSNAELLKLDPSALILTRSIHRGHDWFVDFKQQYRGIDVFGSRVSVRISDRGNIIMLQCDYLPGISIPISPTLSASAANQSASSGLLSSIQSTNASNLLVLPIPTENGFDYRLGYQTEVSTDQPARWFTIVDAASGEILYRRNLIDYFTVDGFVNGGIYPFTPFDSLVVRPFSAQNVNVSGLAALQTDSIGFFTSPVADTLPRRVNLSMAGSFVSVRNSHGSQAALVDTVTPGETLYVNWTSARSRNDERNSYYHVNIVHDFFKALDPEFTGLDFAVPANVNLNQTCNAYWDGTSVNFFMAGGGCTNTGEIADVIYHEYGHGITDYQYRPSSPSGAQHEGWSDYTAATITNQPLIGRGFYSGNPDQYLRTVDNTNHFPEDWQGESHNDGLIIAGALWDLRETLAPRVGYCDSLFHFARYGLSSNYQDYLIDMLEYDDNDDTLFNGTPHWDEITNAFYLHGITPVDEISIAHTPIGDTLDQTHSYSITASVNFTFTPPDPDSVFVCYRLGNSGPFLKSQLTHTANPDEYSGAIPAQSMGTLVEYYLSVSDRHGRVVTSPITAPLPTYFFVVGQLTVQRADSLERSSGWVVGTQEDDATTGIWVRVDPIGTFADSLPYEPFQPEDDHTPDPGIYCYITGQQPIGDPNNGANDVDGGVTSLTTPLYNLSTYDNPVIEYYRWFATNRNVDDTFEVQISSDGGTSWIPVEIITTMANSWQRSRFLVDQVISERSQVKLRFSACDRGTGSIVESGVDDLTFYSFTPTSIPNQQNDGLPVSYALHENYPNPFNGRTEIAYDLPKPSNVTLSVFDITGRLVYQATLLDQIAGKHSLIWDSRQAGRDLASGVYLYRLQASDFAASRKMLLLK